MKRKIKKYKIISHIVWMVIVITLISIIVSMNDKKIYRGARYLESPDGQYVIYQDGGDQDIFGNSSGYMHYALEYDNVYSRVFYGYKEIYTPQIEWYNDGFFVSYYCPECPQSANAGYAFVPESDLSSKFKSERREDGFYIYYWRDIFGDNQYDGITRRCSGQGGYADNAGDFRDFDDHPYAACL